MTSLALDVANYLDSLTAFTVGTNMFVGAMLDSDDLDGDYSVPDVCIAVMEYEGSMPQETYGAGAFAVQWPRIQVLSRGEVLGYATAFNNCEDLRAILAAVVNTNVGGRQVARIRALGSPMPLGNDEKRRPLVSANFEVCLV